MKKYLVIIALTLVIGAGGVTPTAQAAVCSVGTLGQSCITTSDTNGVCVEDSDTGNPYCSALAVTNGGVNPNYIDRNTVQSSGGGINLNVIKPYSDSIIGLINTILVPVFMAIAFIVFLWGVFKYFIWGGENETEKADGRKFAMWGIIGFVIILSLWGIVNILMGALNLTTGTHPKPPTI